MGLKKWYIGLLYVAVTAGGVVHAGGDSTLYMQSLQWAKDGRVDFAYMGYRSILRDYPESQFKQHALFAEAEYAFFLTHYAKSAKLFNAFLKDSSDTRQALFALAYLLKIARDNENTEIIDSLEKRIISLTPATLVFRDFKEYTFISPFDWKCKAKVYINKIEFYMEDKLFETMVY